MYEPTTLSDADEQYLTEIAIDCEERLGPGAELLALMSEPDPAGVRLRLRYRLEGPEHESEAAGATLFEAHLTLRDRILIDRVRFGFAELVERA